MPISPNALFHRPSLQKAIERHLDPVRIADLPEKRAILARWRQAIASVALKQSGEVALHGDFLIDIFARVLGYARQIESPAEWQLAHEQKTLTDATKADGALRQEIEKTDKEIDKMTYELYGLTEDEIRLIEGT